jgi:hypothetical protein
MGSHEMLSCTFSYKSVLSRAHTKDTQFTINIPVIYAYHLRFSSTIAYLNLAYSAANHIQNIFILVGAGKEFISGKKSNMIGRKSSNSYL